MRQAVPSSTRGVTLLYRAFWIKKRELETDKRRNEGRMRQALPSSIVSSWRTDSLRVYRVKRRAGRFSRKLHFVHRFSLLQGFSRVRSVLAGRVEAG